MKKICHSLLILLLCICSPLQAGATKPAENSVKEAQVLGKQVLKSGTSVGAHYRESLRARSNAEVISKLEGGLQELEETQYWIELLTESGIVQTDLLAPLLHEAAELTAILVTCVKRIKERTK